MKNLLFICRENRARSQIAHGLAQHFLGHFYNVFSAGSKPAERVHPMAVAVMAEIGIDISTHKPKAISDIDVQQMDLVVVLCAEEECPVLPPEIKKLNWSMSDPGDSSIPEFLLIRKFRKTRDELRKRVLGLRASDQVW